ncbi:Transcription termination protein NusB [Dehalococcoides mccartyi]|uniref:Transcription termination protein NusB n=1 Tax=Dehalococcoides mccartyi TaxID=61435 RepID=A0A328EKN2_9CHLR|nr:Transcription termination protein NusB [Dehalococcoides mccartyi]
MEQLSYIDRNVLRLAIFEIIHENDVPVKVAINEAVELAKSFGGNSSARFINGVLSSVSKALADTANQREE